MGCRIAVLLVAIYRAHFSGFFGGNCRYFPSCSDYALESLRSQSFGSALKAIVMRLLRCHPFSTGEFIDLPPTRTMTKKTNFCDPEKPAIHGGKV